MLFQQYILSPALCVWQVDSDTRVELPLFTSLVPAGIPSAADDHVDQKLDLNELLVTNRVETRYLRVTGDSMIDANIYDGCILVVDRSIESQPGDVVVCSVDGEFTVKRWEKVDPLIVLHPANDNYEPIYVQPHQQFDIFGVVTWSINPQHRRR